MCQGLRVVAVTNDFRVREVIESSLEAEGNRSTVVANSAEVCRVIDDKTGCNFLILDVSRRTDLAALFLPALLERVDRSCVYILSDPGDSSWKAHAQRWQISKVLIKPLLRQDLVKMLSSCPPLPAAEDESQQSSVIKELGNHGFFLAASPAMIQMHKNIRLLATVDFPVLILGESGVGKEIVARLLHNYHARKDNQFISVNTAAIPSELLESELFGYEPGAFTGAVKAKPGKFELADRGTLLLDEIGEMSLQMQAKLLHVLQDGTFSRLGSRSSTHVDVRILAATNVDMEEAIAEKRFREDLYYRINAFTLRVPSLRERREEIPLLMEQMVNRASAGVGREPLVFSSRLMEAAQEYHWPGNLRELRNFVMRLLVLQDQDAAYEDMRARTRAKSALADTTAHMTPIPTNALSARSGMKGVVNDVKYQTESKMIQEALLASGWNRRRAALNLNISYRTLLYKIQQHGLRA